mmetsp:Transcript_144431/g.204268  ORF Transcript_144431/g.204268 Transcript_144431/m.204268 type:complete len:212 (+) Transcript_144431:816-1451(+)
MPGSHSARGYSTKIAKRDKPASRSAKVLHSGSDAPRRRPGPRTALAVLPHCPAWGKPGNPSSASLVLQVLQKDRPAHPAARVEEAPSLEPTAVPEHRAARASPSAVGLPEHGLASSESSGWPCPGAPHRLRRRKLDPAAGRPCAAASLETSPGYPSEQSSGRWVSALPGHPCGTDSDRPADCRRSRAGPGQTEFHLHRRPWRSPAHAGAAS